MKLIFKAAAYLGVGFFIGFTGTLVILLVTA